MKSLIFWDFKRATWQYDVVVILILAFIFLTPREFFKDQPRAASVVRLPPADGADVYFIEPHVLTMASEPARLKQAGDLISSRYGKRFSVTQLEPIYDAEKEVKGYMAYARP